MPEFHLNPTITQPCPRCGQGVTLLVVPGDQVVACSECKTALKVRLPEEPCRKILRLCNQVEEKVGELISVRLQD